MQFFLLFLLFATALKHFILWLIKLFDFQQRTFLINSEFLFYWSFFLFCWSFFIRKTVFFMYRQFLEIILTQFNIFHRFLSIFTNFILCLYILDHGRYFLLHIFFPTMKNIHCWTIFIQLLNFNVFNLLDLLLFYRFVYKIIHSDFFNGFSFFRAC